MYFMFFRKSNKNTFENSSHKLIELKDEGNEMLATPTEEKLIGLTLLQLLFQLGFALFRLGFTAIIISVTILV